MAAGLNPTLLNRFSRALRPDFTRTILARRIAAGFLVVLAAAAALRPDGAGTREVVVAARDLRPGVLLTGSDLALRAQPAAALPDGAQTVLADVLGATLAGPARRGEVLTDARMLGSRLAGLSAGPDARVVPVRLADPAVLVLDEATAALDPESERRIIDGYEAVMRGRTTILITHRASVARRADRVVVLDGARIVEAGVPGELVERPSRFADLFAVHAAGSTEQG